MKEVMHFNYTYIMLLTGRQLESGRLRVDCQLPSAHSLPKGHLMWQIMMSCINTKRVY